MVEGWGYDLPTAQGVLVLQKPKTKWREYNVMLFSEIKNFFYFEVLGVLTVVGLSSRPIKYLARLLCMLTLQLHVLLQKVMEVILWRSGLALCVVKKEECNCVCLTSKIHFNSISFAITDLDFTLFQIRFDVVMCGTMHIFNSIT